MATPASWQRRDELRTSSTVNDLPSLQKDPFDRILVAQARVEGLTLLTVDKAVAKYGDGVRKV